MACMYDPPARPRGGWQRTAPPSSVDSATAYPERRPPSPAATRGPALGGLHLLDCLLQGPVDVLGVDAELLGGRLFGPGDRVLNRLFHVRLTHDDEPRLTR